MQQLFPVLDEVQGRAWLVQILLEQLAKAEAISARQTPVPAEPFNPRHYFGVAHQSRQKIDEYRVTSREGWN